MARVISSERRRDEQFSIGVAGDPAVAVCSTGSANDATALPWDRLDLLNFVDALACYTAELLAEGRLDDLTSDPELGDDVEQKISFTSASPPSIK